MTRWRYGTIALLLVAVESPMAFADWDVQDSIAGIIIHISWPLQPEDVAVNGNHEIHYVIDGESDMQLGEATTWLRRCIGPTAHLRQRVHSNSTPSPIAVSCIAFP